MSLDKAATLTDDTRMETRHTHQGQGGRQRLLERSVLPINELAPRGARQFVAARLGHHHALDDLLLGTSELVTNAVRHVDRSKAQHLTLAVSLGSGTTRVAVSHRGDVFEPPASAPGGHVTPSGRGLAIVAAISHRWGIDQDEQVTVWFEIDGD